MGLAGAVPEGGDAGRGSRVAAWSPTAPCSRQAQGSVWDGRAIAKGCPGWPGAGLLQGQGVEMLQAPIPATADVEELRQGENLVWAKR